MELQSSFLERLNLEVLPTVFQLTVEFQVVPLVTRPNVARGLLFQRLQFLVLSFRRRLQPAEDRGPVRRLSVASFAPALNILTLLSPTHGSVGYAARV